MSNVNKTLYIPLYGKAYVSGRGLFLDDKKAEEIWKKEGFALKGKAKSKWLAYYMGIRAAVFDDWVRAKLTDTEPCVVIHIGCGMDSRVLRLGAMVKWYDVDFLEVMEERKKYYSESAAYQMLAGDVRDSGWLNAIPERKRAVVVMEGVSMYLSTEELNAFTDDLCAHFEEVELLMDCYTVFGAKMSKHRNPVNEVGVTQVYGIEKPELLQRDGFSFVGELEMTPKKYVDELRGFEKFIFKTLYAGSISKKLYRLYEYKKA